jgi:uncharacterized repeat protein (TIGR03803 family)
MEKLGLLRSACAVSLLYASASITSPAQTFTTLQSFDGTDGQGPFALLEGTDGNFYGITSAGGANTPCPTGNPSGCGTIFEITPAGTLTTLHSFNGTDGIGSGAVLIQGSDGTFYGTTNSGGANAKGSIFSIIPGGSLVTLYSFCSQTNCADGSLPSGLAQGNDGNFYGTTAAGGANSSGTIFEITPAGALTTLYSFPSAPGLTGPPNAPAYYPSGVVQGSDGNFYGPAFGGNQLCGLGNDFDAYCGSIFKVTPEGTLTTLYSFCTQPGCTDGFGASWLVQGTDGNLYGTTAYGGNQCSQPDLGPYYSCGTIFKITPEGTFTRLHAFNWADGASPNGTLQNSNGNGPGLIQGSDGNFYGTTAGGGANSAGTLFKITPSGTLITLYNLVGSSSYGQIVSTGPGGLAQATNGFNGTTRDGGSDSDGTVFSFSLGVGGTTPSTSNLSLSPAIITVGSAGPVVMTATVAPVSGSGTPTGVVVFFNGSNQLGPADLSGGVTTFSYNPSSLALGPYQLSAIYSGDSTFATSTSSAATLTVSSLPAAATPSFSPAPGTYSSTQNVTISESTPGATIYFTDDGTTPTTSSDVYNGPITVSSRETINAIAGASGYLTSGVATAAYTVSLTPDYNLSVSPTTLTIVAGQSGTAKFTVTPMNGFNSAVTFACSDLPSGAMCSFNPSSVTPSGGNAASSTLTVGTTAASATLRGPISSTNFLNCALLVPLFGMILSIRPRRKSPVGGLGVFGIIASLALAIGLTSCGSHAANPSPNATEIKSVVTVTASSTGSGASNHTAALTIMITQ